MFLYTSTVFLTVYFLVYKRISSPFKIGAINDRKEREIDL